MIAALTALDAALPGRFPREAIDAAFHEHIPPSTLAHAWATSIERPDARLVMHDQLGFGCVIDDKADVLEIQFETAGLKKMRPDRVRPIA